jgi:hypothetical protein
MKQQVLLLLSVILFGCINSDKTVYKSFDSSGRLWIIKKTFDKEGRLSVEELLNADSVREGYFKKWNRNRLVSAGKYLKGKKDSTWIYLNVKGDTIKVENWFEGRRFRQQLDFVGVTDSKKPKLHSYSFFNLDGEEVFNVRFDSDSKVDHLNGFPMFTLYNKSHLEPGSVFELTSFVGVPEPLKYIFTIREIDKRSNRIISNKKFSSNSSEQLLETDFGKEFYIEKQYSNSGSYVWRMVLKLTDSSGKILVHDSTDVNVIIHK